MSDATILVRERAADPGHAAAPPVSAIVVGYEGEELVGACLRSLRRACGPHAELILVDNASEDATVAAAREADPAVRVVSMARNAGYGAAANAGVAAARSELCLVLNQDLELEGPVDAVLARLSDDPALALVGCRLRFPDGRPQLGLGREHAPWRLVLSWVVPLGTPLFGPLCARVETDPERYVRPASDAAWVSGALLAFRRATWRQLGGMDEALFLYVEDVELAQRARSAGLRIGYEPSVTACHREASGKAWPGPRALGWTFDGYLYTTRKHGGPARERALRAGLVVACLWRAALHRALAVAGRIGGARRGKWRALQREKALAFAQQAARLVRRA